MSEKCWSELEVIFSLITGDLRAKKQENQVLPLNRLCPHTCQRLLTLSGSWGSHHRPLQPLQNQFTKQAIDSPLLNSVSLHPLDFHVCPMVQNSIRLPYTFILHQLLQPANLHKDTPPTTKHQWMCANLRLLQVNISYLLPHTLT